MYFQDAAINKICLWDCLAELLTPEDLTKTASLSKALYTAYRAEITPPLVHVCKDIWDDMRQTMPTGTAFEYIGLEYHVTVREDGSSLTLKNPGTWKGAIAGAVARVYLGSLRGPLCASMRVWTEKSPLLEGKRILCWRRDFLPTGSPAFWCMRQRVDFVATVRVGVPCNSVKMLHSVVMTHPFTGRYDVHRTRVAAEIVDVPAVIFDRQDDDEDEDEDEDDEDDDEDDEDHDEDADLSESEYEEGMTDDEIVVWGRGRGRGRGRG